MVRMENQMLTVTIRAGRAIRDARLESPSMDGLIVLKLDVGMTLATGGGDIHRIDAGFGIRCPLQVMNAVAVGA